MEFGLQEFETTLRCLSDLDANLLVEPDMEVFGQCVAVYNERLKYGLAIEIKCKCFLINVSNISYIHFVFQIHMYL